VTALVTCALSACGGGGGSTAATSATQVPQQKSEIIGSFGDSTTAGLTYGTTLTPAQSEPGQLQALFAADFAGNVTEVNAGVAGWTAADLLNGTPTTQSWASLLATTNATRISINFGINDSDPSRGQSVQQFEANELELVTMAIAAKKNVVLETSNPVSNPTFSALPDYVAATRRVAAATGVPLIDQYAELSRVPGAQWLGPDGIHPTAAGYALKAQIAYAVLKPLVAKDLGSN